MEPRAAIAEYDAGTDNLTLWNTSQNPHVARLVISAFVGIAPEHKLRVIAPDVGGGFGSKIFIYPEEVVCLWAARKVRPAGEVDGGPLGSLPHRRAWPRSRHPGGIGAGRARQDLGAARQDHRQSRRLYVDLLLVGADLSLRARCCPASTTFRRSIARSMRSTPTPRRSTPIAAPDAPRRPSWSNGWSKWRRGR